MRYLAIMNIEFRPEVVPLSTDRDGVIRVGKTRVTLDTLVQAFNEGATPEEMAQQYPSVDLTDIYAVTAFYLRHRETVESYLAERAQLAQAVRQESEARFDPAGVRGRLLARRANEGA
jgi:uncharacterized protein (DUF433 family)